MIEERVKASGVRREGRDSSGIHPSYLRRGKGTEKYSCANVTYIHSLLTVWPCKRQLSLPDEILNDRVEEDLFWHKGVELGYVGWGVKKEFVNG